MEIGSLRIFLSTTLQRDSMSFFEKYSLVFLVAMMLSIVSFVSDAKGINTLPKERLFYDKEPIKITLHVGQERMIEMPGKGPVQTGIPAKFNRGKLRTQIVGNTIYWLATETFEYERITVVDSVTGRLYLFDLQATGKLEMLPHLIVVDADTERAKAEAVLAANEAQNPSFGYIELTRFASQQLYAPERLLKDIPGVNRVPLDVENPVNLVRGAKIEALPLISWKGGDLYVTAVRLKNLTNEHIVLDPRDLRGKWLGATFQHARVYPKGDLTDTTSVYLISARPFHESM